LKETLETFGFNSFCTLLNVSMKPVTKVLICLCGNLLLLSILGTVVTVFRDPKSKYFQFGPNEGLNVISTTIDTWKKYYVVLCLLALIQIITVLSNELGMPVLGFNIYNPDKKVITDFTKNQLQIYANTTFILSGLCQTTMVVVSVTQIDLAIYSMMIGEVCSFFTIRLLLNEKTFATVNEPEEIESLQDSKKAILRVV